MPNVFSHMFSSDIEGPWWGIRCSQRVYQDLVRQMDDMPRYFVYITGIQGNTLVIAVEGPYQDSHIDDDTIFVPNWVLKRLDLIEGDEIVMEPVLEPVPKATSVTIRPMTGSTVEGPIFLEGLTEALNQLGVIQNGLLSAVVDPSLPDIHEFMVEDLSPSQVCLADGDLTVNIERALDQPLATHVVPTSATTTTTTDWSSILPSSMLQPLNEQQGNPLFRGTGNRLG